MHGIIFVAQANIQDLYMKHRKTRNKMILRKRKSKITHPMSICIQGS